MKAILLPVLLLALVNAGCTNDENPLGQDEDNNQLQPLSIQAAVLTPEAVLSGSRTIVYGTAFPVDSEIGVHVAKGISSDTEGNKGAPGTPYSTTYFTNQMFHFNGSIWTPNADYNLSAEQGTVYAYYPFDAAARFNTAGEANIPVSIQPTGNITVKDGTSATDNVNSSDAIITPAAGEKDFMYYAPGASRAVVSNRAHSAILTMQHALAQVSFRVIKSSNYPGAGNFTGYEIYDTNNMTNLIITSATSSVMSIVDGSLKFEAPSAGILARNIINYQLGTDLAQATIVSNMVFPVATIGTGQLSVRLHIDAEDYTAALPVTVGKSDTWAVGKNYLYSVTLSGTGIEITSVSIVDWVNVDGGNIAIE